jgi:hypothetical protein
MPKGTRSNVITENRGIKIGDKVRLVGAAMPDTIGKVTKIGVDKYIDSKKDNIIFTVVLKNPDDGNHEQPWPVSFDELKKV